MLRLIRRYLEAEWSRHLKEHWSVSEVLLIGRNFNEQSGEDAIKSERLLSQADQALYDAKKNGRNQHQLVGYLIEPN